MIARCLQHVPFEGPAHFEPLLGAAGYRLDCRVVPDVGLPPDPGNLLLVMGGPMSVNDPDPWIEEEIGFIRQAVDDGVPMLGVCLGSQLLARAVGGRVAPGPRFEIGLLELERTPPGAADPLFSALGDRFTVFEWHGEGIHLPPGYPVLAASADYPVQAFRAGPRAYGLLFHVEITDAGVEALCRHCPGDVLRAGVDPQSIAHTAAPRLAELNRQADILLTALLEFPA